MSRDYAKTKRPSRSTSQTRYNSSRYKGSSSRSSTKASHSGWIYLVLGLFLGLLIAGLTYLKVNPAAVEQPKGAHTPKTVLATTATTKETPLSAKNRSHTATPSPAETATPAKPQFDFYTMLPDMKVPGNEENNSKPRPPKSLTPPVAVTKPVLPSPVAPQYTLQIAAFKKNSDAETLKAELAMLGFQAAITNAQNEGITWYRVSLGPYTSLNAAQNVQAQLQANNTKSILVTKKAA